MLGFFSLLLIQQIT